MKITEALKEFFARRANEQDVLNQFGNVLSHDEIAPFLEACTDFAKMGWTAEQITELIDAIVESRIVAFGFGQTHIIGTTDRSKL